MQQLPVQTLCPAADTNTQTVVQSSRGRRQFVLLTQQQ